MLIVVPLVLGLIIFLIDMNVKSQRSANARSSSSDQSFKSSGLTQSFNAKSSQDYTKTIKKNTDSVTYTSSVPSSTEKGPTDLKVK